MSEFKNLTSAFLTAMKLFFGFAGTLATMNLSPCPLLVGRLLCFKSSHICAR
jgi:hypothetical protein